MRKFTKKLILFVLIVAFAAFGSSKLIDYVFEEGEAKELNINKKKNANNEKNPDKITASNTEEINNNSENANKITSDKSEGSVIEDLEKLVNPDLQETDLENISEDDTAPIIKVSPNRGEKFHSPCYMAAEVAKRMNNSKYKGEKIAFLTFDDGVNTTISKKIIATLEEEKINATFFVVGKNLIDAGNQEVLKEAFNNGNAIATHSFNHDYGVLYPDRKANPVQIVEEHKQSVNKMKEILGEKFDTNVFRYPGGHMSWDKESLKLSDEALAKINVNWIDWNSMNGDAQALKVAPNDVPRPRTKQDVIDNFEKSLNFTPNSDQVVILMHDAADKQITADSLSMFIKYLKSKGYSFGVLG